MAIAIVISVLPACGQSPVTGTEQEKSSAKFVIGAGEVRIPQGYFLLIRKGQKIGAVRFTIIEQGGTLGTGNASYESYFQDDGSGLFGSSNVRKRTGEINLKPLKGVGRLSSQFGTDKIIVGKWSFLTGYPGAIDMYPSSGDEKDYGYEFAPTSAKSLEEIDVSDKRLKWFRFNADERVELPVSELPRSYKAISHGRLNRKLRSPIKKTKIEDSYGMKPNRSFPVLFEKLLELTQGSRD